MALGGNIQLFAQSKAMLDVTGKGHNFGLMGQYLYNSQPDNTRGNVTTSGGQFYGPGYFLGVGFEAKIIKYASIAR